MIFPDQEKEAKKFQRPMKAKSGKKYPVQTKRMGKKYSAGKIRGQFEFGTLRTVLKPTCSKASQGARETDSGRTTYGFP